MKFLGSKRGDIDNSVWLSNSDLMAGLMIIFLFISIGFIREKVRTIMKVSNRQIIGIANKPVESFWLILALFIF